MIAPPVPVAEFPDWAFPDCPASPRSAAADYFSRQSVKSFVRALERAEIPNHLSAWFIYTPDAGRAVSLQSAIVEMPADLARFERRDPHTAYLAYVRIGRIARVRQLALGGDHGRAEPCSLCHGADLRGGTTFPGAPLARHFPGRLYRQLYGFQSGARAGEAAQAMQPIVATLTQADRVDLATCAASLQPYTLPAMGSLKRRAPDQESRERRLIVERRSVAGTFLEKPTRSIERLGLARRSSK